MEPESPSTIRTNMVRRLHISSGRFRNESVTPSRDRVSTDELARIAVTVAAGAGASQLPALASRRADFPGHGGPTPPGPTGNRFFVKPQEPRWRETVNVKRARIPGVLRPRFVI